MFDHLTKRLTSIFDTLKGKGALTEGDVNNALRDIRVALLEADVALVAVKHFIETVRPIAIGNNVLKSITPGQMITKIVYDHLVDLLGGEISPLQLNAAPPVVYLMAGLQGSGKTTSSAKLAHYLKTKLHKKPMLASLDVYRPAAQQQLSILAERLGVSVLEIVEGEKPLAIAKRALETAKKQAIDVLILDTAGRLHCDDTLMNELKSVQNLTNPLETFLVADAMTGQDAAIMAKTFHEAVTLTGIILTRLDGDARGGAALSMRHMTGCPIKFLGVGEKPEQWEIFEARRLADRILDRGDVVALVEKAALAMDQEDAEKMAAKMQKGVFDLNDLQGYLHQMIKMGGMSGIMSLLPGVGKIKDKMIDAGMDDKLIRRQIAIIQSMTKKEKRTPTLLNASRKRRIAKGAGVDVAAINRLLKQYEQMADMMKRMKKMGGPKGLMRGGIKGLLGM